MSAAEKKDFDDFGWVYEGFEMNIELVPIYMAVSENGGTPKWMVFFHGTYFLMDDLGGKTPYFRKHPYFVFWGSFPISTHNSTLNQVISDRLCPVATWRDSMGSVE